MHDQDGNLSRDDDGNVTNTIPARPRSITVTYASDDILGSAEIRAARGFLSWTARDLAEKAGVSFSTVRRIEDAQGKSVRKRSLDAIRAALQQHGVYFVKAEFGASGMIFVSTTPPGKTESDNGQIPSAGLHSPSTD